MKYIVLYWGVMFIGYAYGYRRRGKKSYDSLVNVVMLISISFLVLVMGMRMGANQQVIDNIGNIGVISVVITLLMWVGALLPITITRKIMGIDKFGYIKGNKGKEEPPEEKLVLEEIDEIESVEEVRGDNGSSMTWCIVISVIAGIAIGFFAVRNILSATQITEFYSITSYAMTVGLCLMMTFVGYGMGYSGDVVSQFKTIGARVFAFPAAVVIGTTLMAIVIGLIVPIISVRESLAIGYGFGWYSFAPVAITNAGHEIAGAISFLHNVFRELGGIVLIPVLANKVGYIEVTGLPGSAAGDVCIPIVQKATRDEIIAYSFLIGVTEGFLTTILVPLVIGA